MRCYDAIFLDAQGTLLSAYPSVAAIYGDICRELGCEVPDSRVARALREQWVEFKRSYLARDDQIDTSDEITRKWWEQFNGRLFERLGMREGKEQFLDALWEVFGRSESWRLYPEVREVLAELRRRDYALGVVSNWDSRLLPICDGLGITRYLRFILASAPAGVEKPDPRIFQIALSRASVPADRALHVGDDYEADILGAQAGGIDALLVDRTGEGRSGVPTICSLLELLEILP